MLIWFDGAQNPTSRRVVTFPLLAVAISLGALTGCNIEEPLSQARVIVAEFDPENGVIPTPNDLLTDDETGLIHIPDSAEDLAEKSAVEIALIGQLNRRAAWSTRSEAKISFSGALDPNSINEETVRVIRVEDSTYTPVEAVIKGEPAEAPETLIITAPGMGWKRGAQFFISVVGGTNGLRGQYGENVVADAAFWFLRQEESLLDHTRAMPGATPEERLEKAEALEDIRQDLYPFFEHMKTTGLERGSIAHLWSFNITQAPEILMDKELQKMPLPSDFLRNPATGTVEIPIYDDYDDFKKENLAAINTFDGFGLSSDLYFELTSPINVQTLNADSVKLFARQADGTMEEVAIDIQSRNGDKFIKIRPTGGMLNPDTFHMMVVTTALQNAAGVAVEAMTAGMLAMIDAPLVEEGRSALDALDNDSASRLELVRSHTSPGLANLYESGKLEAGNVAAAWTFKTMEIRETMLRSRDLAINLNTDPTPIIEADKTVFDSILEFPIGAVSMFNVERVIDGYIMMPNLLDHTTRKNYEDGTWSLEPVRFTMTIPKNVRPDEPLKTVIFGHAIVTERRMVYAMADTMAQNGYATIGIDFPYHGERTHCTDFGPMCQEDPLNPGEFICPEACQSGYTCAEDGRCVDINGEGNYLNKWPILPMYQASGAAFIEIDNLYGTTHHFYQAIADLNTLLRSLRQGDWRSAIGYDIAPDFGYVGQSLGGIIGSVFTSTQPIINRSVLNVPGGNLIPLFQNSPWFGQHFQKFIDDHGFVPGSQEFDQAMMIARWLADPVDPQTFARYLLKENFNTGEAMPDRKVIIQMATLDTIIPNDNTLAISERGDIPRYDYPASHGFIVIPVEPSYLPGHWDAESVLTEGVLP